MALGDILTAAINAEGWTANIAFSGFVVGGTLTLNPDTTPTLTFNVSSAGYDATGTATTVSRTVIGTIAKRQPYPNETLRVESANSGNAMLTIALSDVIHPTDTLTLTAAAGVLVDNGTGGTGASSNATSGFAVTNGSTFSPQKPIAAWLTPQFQRATADFAVELAVAHRFGRSARMVAAVKFVATGQTSLATASVTVSAMSASAFGGRTGLSIPVFAGTIPLAGFTQGEIVKVDAIVYPFIGPALQASVDGHAWPSPNLVQLQFLCDKTGAYSGATAWCDIVGGSDATGAVNDSTHKFATVGKAINAIQAWHNANKGRNNIDGGTILLEAGTYQSFGPTDASLASWGGNCLCEIKADAGHGRSDITYNMSDTTNVFIPGGSGGGLKWSNITFSSTGGATFGFRGSNATSQYMWFDQCDLIGDNSVTAPLYQCGYQAFTDCRVFKMPATLSPFSNTVQAACLIAGCDIDTITDAGILGYTVAGNKFHNGTTALEVVDNSLTAMPVPDQAFVIGNSFSLSAFACTLFDEIGYTPTNGIAFVQNLIEITAATEVQPALQIAADGDETAIANCVVVYNTVVGARTNYLYNDGTGPGGGSVSTFKDGIRRFNILSNFNNKTDTFLGSGGGNGARVGNWTDRFGVGSFGNTNQTGSFSGTAPGPDSWLGDYLGIGDVAISDVGTANPYNFTSAAYSTAYGGTGAGGGNYTIATPASSKAKALVPAGAAMLPFDIAGVARTNDGTGFAGAYEGASAGITVSLSGATCSAAAGGVTLQDSLAISGAAVIVSAGAVSPAVLAAAAGAAAVATAGVVSTGGSGSVALTGAAASAIAGSAAAADQVTLAGVAAVISAGLVSFSGAVNAAVAGAAANALAGGAAIADSLAVAGAAAVAGCGVLAPALSASPAGAAVQAAAGSLAKTETVAPSGAALAALAGFVAGQVPGSVSLFGAFAQATAGVVTVTSVVDFFDSPRVVFVEGEFRRDFVEGEFRRVILAAESRSLTS